MQNANVSWSLLYQNLGRAAAQTDRNLWKNLENLNSSCELGAQNRVGRG